MKISSNYLLILLILSINNILSQSYYVTNDDELKSAVNDAQPGDTIIVRSGRFDTDGSVTIRNSGTKENRIIIIAEVPGDTEFYNESYFDFRQCSYITLTGFIFNSQDVTAVKLQASNNIRITNNVFSIKETESLKWIVIGGIWDNPNAMSHDNRIDHNLFMNKTKAGNFITIDGTPDPTYKSSQRDTIDHNYFVNNNPRITNEKESIRVGWSELSMTSGFTVIEYNLFEDCNGDPEIVSVKTCDNIVRNNTFRRCQGTLSLRHGNRTEVYGNFFFGENVEGTGGIRIYGDDHKIYNNYFEGLSGTKWDAPITLTNGDYDGGSNYSKHFRINRAKIVNNTLVDNFSGIEIGFTNNGNYSKPPRDVEIANNIIVGSQNDIVSVFSEPVNMNWNGNIFYATGSAEVGIDLSENEIKTVNPGLEYNQSIFRLTAESPAIDSATGEWDFIIYDIDGQERDSQPDIGADEYLEYEEITNKPLTPNDVGPSYYKVTSVESDESESLDQSFLLQQNYPNPFNGTTMLNVIINSEGTAELDLYNVMGQKLKEIFKGRLNKGARVFELSLNEFSAGIYFIRFNMFNESATKKIMYLK